MIMSIKRQSIRVSDIRYRFKTPSLSMRRPRGQGLGSVTGSARFLMAADYGGGQPGVKVSARWTNDLDTGPPEPDDGPARKRGRGCQVISGLRSRINGGGFAFRRFPAVPGAQPYLGARNPCWLRRHDA